MFWRTASTLILALVLVASVTMSAAEAQELRQRRPVTRADLQWAAGEMEQSLQYHLETGSLDGPRGEMSRRALDAVREFQQLLPDATESQFAEMHPAMEKLAALSGAFRPKPVLRHPRRARPRKVQLAGGTDFSGARGTVMSMFCPAEAYPGGEFPGVMMDVIDEIALAFGMELSIPAEQTYGEGPDGERQCNLVQVELQAVCDLLPADLAVADPDGESFVPNPLKQAFCTFAQLNGAECEDATHMNELHFLCADQQGHIDTQDSITELQAQIVSVEDGLSQQIAEHDANMTAEVDAAEAALLAEIVAHDENLTTHDESLTAHDQNLNTQAGEIKTQIAVHDGEIKTQISVHDMDIKNQVATHDSDIKQDIEEHDTEIKAAIAQHDAEVKAMLEAAEQLALRIGIERALLEKQRYAVFYLPQSHGGQLEMVRDLVGDTIAAVAASGEGTNFADARYASGLGEMSSERYKRAFNFFALAYCEAIKLPGETCPE